MVGTSTTLTEYRQVGRAQGKSEVFHDDTERIENLSDGIFVEINKDRSRSSSKNSYTATVSNILPGLEG